MNQQQTIEIKPQAGPQELALSSSADIVFYGGSAGGGKSWMLLYEPIRHLDNPNFGAIIFRRELPQITNEGGLWDQAVELYPHLGGVPVQSPKMQYRFPSGAKITFAHLQHDKTVSSYDGSQVPLFEFDELQHFSRRQFFYMMTRNRSMCGVKPYIRASMNPVPPDNKIGGWLHEFVGWYLDADGYADPAKSGVIRWFITRNEKLIWGDSREELVAQYPKSRPKSFTFILSRLKDNKILCDMDPDYKANLEAQPLYERERLMGDEDKGGNWFVAPSAGKVFNRAWFKIVPAAPVGGEEVSAWDGAATEKSEDSKDPDFTVNLCMRKINGQFYITTVVRERIAAAEFYQRFENLNAQHRTRCRQISTRFKVRFEQEPGAAAKREAQKLCSLVAGVPVKAVTSDKDKVTRTRGLSSQAMAGNVFLVEGHWNEDFLSELHNFPEGSHDDQVDAASLAFNELNPDIPGDLKPVAATGHSIAEEMRYA